MSSEPSTTPLPLSHTEQQILSSFLVTRADLPSILPLRLFTELFPPPLRRNPQIKLLYRHLQLQRTQLIDRVTKNVKFEVLQGKRQRARRIKQSLQQQQEGRGGGADGVGGGGSSTSTSLALFGTTPYEPIIPLKELLVQMEDAAEELTREERRLEDECAEILKMVKEWVGDLSDLRYGKFSTQGMEGKVIEQLRNLAETCDRIVAEKDGAEDVDEEGEDEDDGDEDERWGEDGDENENEKEGSEIEKGGKARMKAS